MRRLIPLLCMLALLGTACVTVDEGEAVLPTRFGEAREPITEPGLHFFNFITHNAVSYPVRPVELSFSQDPNTQPSIQALSAEGASVGIDASILVRVDGDRVAEVYQRAGSSWESVLANIVIPTTRSVVRDCIPLFDFEAARTSGRGEAQECIRSGLAEDLDARGIVVEEVLLREMRADASLQAAIDQKLEAQNAVKEAEFRQQQASVDARTAVIAAEGEKEAAIVEAEGIAEANRLVAQSLTPELLQLRIVQELGENTVYFFGGDGVVSPRIDAPVGQ